MARGGYTFEEVKNWDETQFQFINHYQVLAEEERQQFLINILGVVWKKEDLMSTGSSEGKAKPDKFFTPLSTVIRTEIMDDMREKFGLSKEGKKISKGHIGGGDYQPKAGEQVISMGDLSKEDFKKMMQSV